MKMKLFLLPLLALTALQAEELKPLKCEPVKQQLGYVTFGLGPVPVPIPNFSAGYRFQKKRYGGDFSVQATSVEFLTSLKSSAYFLHFPKPSYESEFYLGAGSTFGGLFGDKKRNYLFFGPELLFGKQYRNETSDLRFFQMQIMFPTINWREDRQMKIYAYPAVIFSYGLGF